MNHNSNNTYAHLHNPSHDHPTSVQRDHEPDAGPSVHRIDAASILKSSIEVGVGHRFLMLCLALIFSSAASALASPKDEGHERKANILYIWAGDAARTG